MAGTVQYLAIFLACAGIWSGLALAGLIDGFRQEALRWRYLARGERASDAPLVFVDLDVPTTSRIGNRPWDRRLFGVVAHALLGPGGARAVGIDFILSRFGTSGLLDGEKARAGDEFLGSVVGRHPGKIVLAAAYTGAFEDYDRDYSDLRLIREGHDDPALVPFPEAPTFPIIKWGAGRLGLADVDEGLSRGAVPSWVPAFVDITGPRYSLHLLDGLRRYWLPLAPQTEVVAREDAFVLVDGDGFEIVRLPRESSQRLLTLGLELFLAARGLGAGAVERSGDRLLVRGEDGGILRAIPLAAGQSLEVNWFNRWGNPELETHVSLYEVLERADRLAKAAETDDAAAVAAEEAWFARFRDRVVLLGPVDPTLKDVAPTPFDRHPVPKVGLHANVFRTVHEGAFIRRLPPLAEAGLTLGLTLLAGGLALWSGRGRILTRLAALLLVLGYGLVAFEAFSRDGWVLPLVAPAGSVASALLLGALVKLSAEEWQRRRIRSLFGTYVSPALVERMVDEGESPRLGGVEAAVTALFSDVEGFSSISEKLPPERLVALMNEYLSAMTEIIRDEGGTLDKYVGDAVIAMFGMPVRLEDHAARAARAALGMQRRHAELRERWRRGGDWPAEVPRMRTRIGLNTGPAVVGNMGSDVRFNYTMMGDAVNLAARCEAVGKVYGVYSVVAEPMAEVLGGDLQFRLRRLDRVAVKGRAHAVHLFQLWDGIGGPDRFEACRAAYEAALEAYFAADWSGALAGFEKAAAFEEASTAGTHPSAVLAGRCRKFLESGPPPGWDGVYRMQ
jgi:adenylate cyclase